ncbi:MAG: aminopeptidase P family protein [Vannielia sp.]|uniref:M24 family metallopeptidase n=1 Tax=Vannielia sp. TaxID=2813045 RepID=UPI003B8DFB1D
MTTRPAPPFDTTRLDHLMDAAGVDVVIASSKHNIQYLLGDYRFFMFEAIDAIGLTRYLPLLVYPAGRPELAFYIANSNERFELELNRFWVPEVITKSRGTVDAMQMALDGLAERGLSAGRIAVETGFLPADAWDVLRTGLPGTPPVDAVEILEELRAVKSPKELDLLRMASDGVVGAMQATFAQLAPGMTKNDAVDILRREEIARGLTWEYCLITAGQSLNRAPSAQVLEPGDILSLDSGGNCSGYLGDLCRMGALAPPSAELQDALAQIEEVQQAARKPLRADAPGGAPFEAVADLLKPTREGSFAFVVHGVGLITHEAPRLMDNGPIPYPAPHRTRPLEAGMVLSVETTWQHPRLGFIKLEDTVAITETGCEAFGDTARGWNLAG